ncbi:MAG: hypothetical protein FWE27_06560 [Defluviitaleaceae bacterium]|nr:hypothetical protein [Defluviitaleaceae bacterium]
MKAEGTVLTDAEISASVTSGEEVAVREYVAAENASRILSQVMAQIKGAESSQNMMDYLESGSVITTYLFEDGSTLTNEVHFENGKVVDVSTGRASIMESEPLIAEINPESGMTLYYQYGKLLECYDDNQTLESFRHLIRANYIAANPVFCSETGTQLHRNTTVYDNLTRNVYVYDMDGNVTVTSYDDKMITINVFDENGNVIGEKTMSVSEDLERRERIRVERLRNEGIIYDCEETGELLYRTTTIFDDLTRNVFVYDNDTVTVTSYDEKMVTCYMYDENGKEKEVTLSVAEFIDLKEIEIGVIYDFDKSIAIEIQMSSSFSEWPVFSGTHHTPPSSSPATGPPIGGVWYNVPSSMARYLDIGIRQSIPADLWLHAFFTNVNGKEKGGFREGKPFFCG